MSKKKQLDSQEEIKRLLIVLLLTRRVKASTIAKALEVDKSVISRLVPVTEILKTINKD